MRRLYTTLAEPSGPWWAITVLELPGVFSQTRRLDGVEAMARDAISLFLDVAADSFDVVVREGLDDETRQLVDDAIRAREEARERQLAATAKSQQAVRALRGLGLPHRDIARLMRLSHQRVAQVLGNDRHSQGRAPARGISPGSRGPSRSDR